ncbi:hypothetical protein OOT00_12990 [Desulfobotulus sp. H1]|uniref:Uncharacterized protein n=1 Tax=Desulfobotulus pelophilus TaxID=2823377 RepID=A0ABT3NBR3_9BACT|nr:hypothetical protein [Desulfobotulus pelophilus]MCW7754901.1 hypothetical protein [Desulfobotulus pelophilus]
MKVKVIKQGSSYVLPILENTDLELDSFYVEIDPSLEVMLPRVGQSNTIHKLRELNDTLGVNDYLSFKLNNLSLHYTYAASRNESDGLFDALRSKHL